MHGSDNVQYYILLEDVQEENTSSSDHSILQRGSIWIEQEAISLDIVLVGKYEGEDTGKMVELAISVLQPISYQETHLILAVPPPLENRMLVIMNRSWIQEGLNIKVDNVVKINFPDIPGGAKGVVRYKGRLPGKNGVFFGVELDEIYAGKGTTNGVFRRKKLFTCDEDCGVFVSIFRVRLNYTMDKNNKFRPETEGGITKQNTYFEDKYFDKGTTAGSNTTKYKSNSIEMDKKSSESLTNDSNKSNEYNLKINERAVWMADDGPKFCTVLWIGVLPDSADGKTVVGVEFDEPIGSGTGKYQGKQLFRAKRRHASLMPVLGLLRADVYMSMLVDEEHSYKHNAVESSDYADFSVAQKKNFHSGPTEIPLKSQNEPVIPSTSLLCPEQVTDINKSYSFPQNQLSKLNLNSNLEHDTRESSAYHTGSHDASDSVIVNPFSIQDSTQVNLRNRVSNSSQQSMNIHDLSTSTSYARGQNEKKYIPSIDFKIGDRVTVALGSEWYGIIRWLGTFPQSKHPDRVIAGVELDTIGPDVCTDGTFMSQRFFSCKPKHALFIPLNKCAYAFDG